MAGASWAGGAYTPTDAAHKFQVLHPRCEEVGRPYGSILRSTLFSPLILAETPAAIQAKLDQFPKTLLASRPDGVWWGVEAWHCLLAQGDTYGGDASVPLVFVHLLREPLFGQFSYTDFLFQLWANPDSACSMVGFTHMQAMKHASMGVCNKALRSSFVFRVGASSGAI
jgi:hypothetical protein